MELYSEIILDYYKHPVNKEKIEDATTSAVELNPLCGDKVEFFIKSNEKGEVIKTSYQGDGCAISQAATSMLTEHLEGKTLKEISEIDNQEIYDMLGVEISPARVKCALLGLVAAKKAVLLHKHKINEG
jgi:nitrogen fixation protein NifU and related proteins